MVVNRKEPPMPINRSSFVLPLAKDPSSRFLAWITALMSYLAALALAGAMAVSDMAQRWDNGLAGGLTVQISAVPDTDGAGRTLAERTEAALTVLRATDGIRTADALSAKDASRLLEPWLGPDSAADPLLPVPVLIDVVTDGPVAVASLAERLAKAVPGATLDDHAVWLSDLRAFTRAVEIAALCVVAVIGGAGVMAVVFAVRAGLAIHQGVVQLLHHMGATDGYVAHQFEVHVLGLSLRGGGGGLVLAALTLLGLNQAADGLRATILPDLSMDPAQWLALALIPVAAAMLAVVTARLTVLRTLETMP